MKITSPNFTADAIEIDGAKYYSARSVARYLGLKSNPSQIRRNLCQSEFIYGKVNKGLGGPELLISERGLFKLFIYHSNKKQLEFFTNWLARYVLPSIEATGEYTLT